MMKLILFSAVVVLIVGVAGVSTLRKQNVPKEEVKKVNAVEYKQLSNSPTSKPEKDKKDIRISILNGTGISGQAGEIMKVLVASGYSIENIESSNAETFTHTQTTITSRADLEDTTEHIKNILQSIFPELTEGTPNTNPNDDSGYDVVITTGSKIEHISPSTSPVRGNSE